MDRNRQGANEFISETSKIREKSFAENDRGPGLALAFALPGQALAYVYCPLASRKRVVQFSSKPCR